ncbi:MAG: beta-ketoacyl synthase chain length factor [Bacteroidia bacterium]|nr:beta-ketoacyl synthase chain length factor [Bacteroidia bacterium]
MNKYPVYIQAAASIHPENPLENNAFSAKEPDYKEWIKDAGLRRRMSRIVKMGVTAGLQCLHLQNTKVDAIITATGLGCLSDTEKFLKSISEQNEELLSPTPFIQSTFNTIGGQIALLTGNKSYNMTYVHRAFSFETALLDAMLMLQAGDAENVLVGAVDELTPTVFGILERMGTFRKFFAGEGSSFFLLSRNKTDNTIAEIIDIDIFSGSFSEQEILAKQTDFLKNSKAENADVFSDKIYKQNCGEFHTASAFGLYYACKQSDKNEKILVTNSFLNNHTSILIDKF